MNRLTYLSLELCAVDEQINVLSKQKKDIIDAMKAERNRLRDLCGKTGKTIEELEEEDNENN